MIGHKLLTVPATIKAASSVDLGNAGTFEAVVAVFGNVDTYRDVVMPGAFTESLELWKASGDPIPVVWNHDWGNPDSHIGIVTEARELLAGDPALPPHLAAFGGLFVAGVLDIEDTKAAKIHRLLKGRRVTQFSFAYDTIEAAEAERDGRYVNELRKLHVLEVGPTLIGVNRSTDLLDAKADGPDVTIETKALDTLVALRSKIDEAIAAASAAPAPVFPANGDNPPANDAPAAPPAEPIVDPLAVAIQTFALSV